MLFVELFETFVLVVHLVSLSRCPIKIRADVTSQFPQIYPITSTAADKRLYETTFELAQRVGESAPRYSLFKFERTNAWGKSSGQVSVGKRNKPSEWYVCSIRLHFNDHPFAIGGRVRRPPPARPPAFTRLMAARFSVHRRAYTSYKLYKFTEAITIRFSNWADMIYFLWTQS